MIDNAPDFGAGVDQSAFQVGNTAGLKSQADAITNNVNGINYDWSKVDSAVGQLAGLSGYFQDASKGGPGATAGQQVKMQQENLGAAPQTAADLGKALMRMSQGGVAQAAQQQQAQSQQSMAFAKQAQAMKEQVVQTQMAKMKADLQLSDAKFQITREMQKSKDGLDLANLTLKNMLNYGLANAKNAKALDDLAAQKANMEQVFSYIGAGLGATSSVLAGVAVSANSPAASGDQWVNEGSAAENPANGIPQEDLTGTVTDAGSNTLKDFFNA